MLDPDQVQPKCEFEIDKFFFKLDAIIPSNTQIIDNTVTNLAHALHSSHAEVEHEEHR